MKEEFRYYWARVPGKFVVKTTGDELPSLDAEFNGSVREWYETLFETIRDGMNLLKNRYNKFEIHISPKAFTILEASCRFQNDCLFFPRFQGYLEDIPVVINPLLFKDEVRLQDNVAMTFGIIKILNLEG